MKIDKNLIHLAKYHFINQTTVTDDELSYFLNTTLDFDTYDFFTDRAKAFESGEDLLDEFEEEFIKEYRNN